MVFFYRALSSSEFTDVMSSSDFKLEKLVLSTLSFPGQFYQRWSSVPFWTALDSFMTL